MLFNALPIVCVTEPGGICDPDGDPFQRTLRVDDPAVLAFPKVLVCLDCGSSRLNITDHYCPACPSHGRRQPLLGQSLRRTCSTRAIGQEPSLPVFAVDPRACNLRDASRDSLGSERGCLSRPRHLRSQHRGHQGLKRNADRHLRPACLQCPQTRL